ncbi:MAG: hypothetical protein A3K68_01195 [Euryarchaeota archaeon RBG_16_68_13]|nr:MAG: hypothetical protein A3K68_01195 [Euryarchaeota archaeon RBG_16_68_13]
MTEVAAHGGSDKVEILVYVGYLVAFMVLLAASIQIFGFTWLLVAFEVFTALAILLVAGASRIMR